MSVLGIAAFIGAAFLMFLSALFVVQIIKIFIPTKSYVPGFLFGLFSILSALGAGWLMNFGAAALFTVVSVPLALGVLSVYAVVVYIATGFSEKLVDSSAS